MSKYGKSGYFRSNCLAANGACLLPRKQTARTGQKNREDLARCRTEIFVVRNAAIES
jgi:hypothetical protein